MFKWGWLTVVFVLIGMAIAPGQSLTHLEFPSEDELQEALELQEINYDQYLQLRELAGQQLDSTNLHLLDQIPNLSFFRRFDTTAVSSEERDQAEIFRTTSKKPALSRYRLSGAVHYQYLQEAEEDGASWYRTRVDLHYDQFSLLGRIQRERSGRERLVERTVTYRPSSGPVREIALGNLSRRLGLGTAYGYHGRVVDIPEGLTGDALLYPSYSGINGGYVSLSFSKWESEALVSSHRGDDFQLSSAAARLGRTFGHHLLSLIIAADRIRNRESSAEITIAKAAANDRYRYSDGYIEMELTGLSGDDLSSYAAVVEGSHRKAAIQFRYAAWSYGRQFADLSSGSKSGSMSQSVKLEEINLDLSSRRTGQDGILLRTLADLADRVQLRFSLLYYDNDSHNPAAQLSTGLEYLPGEKLSLDLSYLGDTKDARLLADNPGLPENLYKLEIRFGTGRLTLRSYIAYNDNDGQKDEWSALAVSTFRFENGHRLRLWCRIKGFESTDRRYRYFFVESLQPLSEYLTFETKLSYSYSSSRTDKGSPWVTIGLNAAL